MHRQHHDLVAAVPGTARQIHSFHYGPDQAFGKIYIQASLHADELPGMLVLWHLKQRLLALEAARRLRKQIVLVPVANPIGLEQVQMDVPQGRFDSESRENFNRHFVDFSTEVGDSVEPLLTDNVAHNTHLIRQALVRSLAGRQARTQLQSMRLVLQRLACDADIVLDLHCDFEAVQHLYASPDFWTEVEPLARYLGARACFLAREAGGQSFDERITLFWLQIQSRFASRFPVTVPSFAVTLELRGVGDVSHEFARADSQALIDYLTYVGAIEGQVAPLPPLLNPPTPLAGVEPVCAPHAGLVVFCAEVGDYLQAGQTVGEIIDPITDLRTPVICAREGLLYVCSLRRMATAGMAIAHIAGPQAYRSGELLSP